jgi:uncharacterized protein involved in tolerance to divalent cations
MPSDSAEIFISYASPDLSLAQTVNDKLIAAGFSVWFDKVRLNSGYKWHEEIEAACEAARLVVPILTLSWKQSLWTKFETYGHDEIIPLWAEGKLDDVFTPPPSGDSRPMPSTSLA